MCKISNNDMTKAMVVSRQFVSTGTIVPSKVFFLSVNLTLHVYNFVRERILGLQHTYVMLSVLLQVLL